jgi:hypothetical protein
MSCQAPFGLDAPSWWTEPGRGYSRFAAQEHPSSTMLRLVLLQCNINRSGWLRTARPHQSGSVARTLSGRLQTKAKAARRLAGPLQLFMPNPSRRQDLQVRAVMVRFVDRAAAGNPGCHSAPAPVGETRHSHNDDWMTLSISTGLTTRIGWLDWQPYCYKERVTESDRGTEALNGTPESTRHGYPRVGAVVGVIGPLGWFVFFFSTRCSSLSCHLLPSF